MNSAIYGEPVKSGRKNGDIVNNTPAYMPSNPQSTANAASRRKTIFIILTIAKLAAHAAALALQPDTALRSLFQAEIHVPKHIPHVLHSG